jgi:hypothetical protein
MFLFGTDPPSVLVFAHPKVGNTARIIPVGEQLVAGF